MKKGTVKKTAQATAKSQKITAFFTKYEPLQFKTESPKPNGQPANISEICDDDVIEQSPSKYSYNNKMSPSVLEDVTNVNEVLQHSTPLKHDKKRKELGKYPDDIPDFQVEQPIKKKPCVAQEGVKIISLAEATKSDFEKLQTDLERKKNERQLNGLIKRNKNLLGMCNKTSENPRTPNEVVDISSEKSRIVMRKKTVYEHEKCSEKPEESEICNTDENIVSEKYRKQSEHEVEKYEKPGTSKANEEKPRPFFRSCKQDENKLNHVPKRDKTPEKSKYFFGIRRKSEDKTPEKPKQFFGTHKQNEEKSHVPRQVERGHTTPPVKKLSPSRNGCTMRKSSEKIAKRSPSKRSPSKKLFEKSPNVGEFKVEVLSNFVKITPSQSQQMGLSPRYTPVKSGEKKQSSILQYTSPSSSRRSFEAQNMNERTPDHKSSARSLTPSSKVKMKLDFSLSNTLLTVIKKNSSEIKTSSTNNVNVCVLKKNVPEKNDDMENLFNDSWEEDFQFTAKYGLDLSQSQHCKVLEITKSDFIMTLVVQSTKSEDRAICTLSDFWAHVKLEIGSTVHVTAVQNRSSEWVVNNNGGLLVYEPDFLISSTSVVGALFCKRKSILKDRYAGFDSGNKVMLVGILVHTLLQTSLKNKLQTTKEITHVIEDLLSSRDTVFKLYELSITKSEMETELKGFVPRIITFMEQYMTLNLGKYPISTEKNNWKGRIDSIQDIEENIWCPELGVKGKVDVSLKVQGSIMPLELKTGRASLSLEHRGQIVLYIMMMNKLGYKVPSGLLLYLREGVVREISMDNRERRDIIMLRNELAYYLTRRPSLVNVENAQDSDSSGSFHSNLHKDKSVLVPGELPPPINHHSACGRCEYNTVCCIYLKKDETDLTGFKNLSEVRDVTVSHLDKVHIDYFTHWSSLLALENGVTEGKNLREIYTKSPEERQKHGKCIINVTIIGKVSDNNGLYSTTFGKEDPKSTSFLSSGIGESSYIVVSRDTRPAVAAGLVSHIDHMSVTLDLDRDLSKKYPGCVFHLDTYDSNSINTFNFTSLSLLTEPTERADSLRKLIIEKIKPTFKKTLPSDVGKKSGPILKRMNKMQQKAVIKALAANDYLLIKGMPGTGKTATIVALVQFLVQLNYSVLITSHTHSAVDNVCVRLQECGMDVLRLGSESRIHPKLKARSEHALTKHCKTPEELELVYNSANILAVTCIGSKHPIFSKRTLDVCIVDESTQVLQCSVFRPLYATKKFILIGDPDQLPPVVKNQEAQARGLSESLFERLQSPESVVTLSFNYRMNKVITALANDLTYKGQLLIANDTIANASLRLPKLESLMVIYQAKQWVLQALNDDLRNSVCIVDTGPVWNKVYNAEWIQRPSIEKEGDQVVLACTNPSEVAVIITLVQALIKGGMSPSGIGVIAPYRAQVAQISAVLQDSGVDVSTVDQFQGQDKEVILYSCTKSRDLTKPKRVSKFEILEDKRRLTVAVTRAKHKFIVVADVGTIREYSPFSRLFSCVHSDYCVYLMEGGLGFEWEQTVKDCRKLINA